jgi:hypothetical protein
MRKIAMLCALALILPASDAAGLPLKPWLGVSGSINTYEMGDLNSRISDISLTSIDEIGKGFAFGVHGGVAVSPMLMVGAGYEFLTAGSDISGLPEQFDFNLPAHAFRGGIELRAPTPGPLKLGAGASVGRVSAAGDVLAAGLGAEFENLVGEISGSGPLFEGYAVADIWFSPMMALSPAVGYRYAKISEVKVDGTTFINPLDGSEYSLDYSGYYMRLTLKLSLP